MKKINFINNSEPSLSAETLNRMQDNIEEAMGAYAPLATTPQTPNGDTQITYLQLSYNNGWILYIRAITNGAEHGFQANLTQIS